MTGKQLLDLKDSIEKAKRKQAEVEGKKLALLESLNKQFGLQSVAEAKKELTKLQKDLEKLEAKKLKKVEELERDYEF